MSDKSTPAPVHIVYASEEARAAVTRAARGEFQRDFCAGLVPYSCAHLRGKAGSYRSRYKASLRALLERSGRRWESAPDRAQAGLIVVYVY